MPIRSAHFLLAIPSKEKLQRVLRYVLDEKEFLSPYGIRSISKFHKDHPWSFTMGGKVHTVQYEPGESRTGTFGGNSNWRGPVWFPINYLLVESLERYHHFYGEDFKVECPVGSGKMLTLSQVALELSRRMAALFLPNAKGIRPYTNGDPRIQGEHWKDLLLFHEYFDGDTGRGCGASHQTGWTGSWPGWCRKRRSDRGNCDRDPYGPHRLIWSWCGGHEDKFSMNRQEFAVGATNFPQYKITIRLRTTTKRAILCLTMEASIQFRS